MHENLLMGAFPRSDMRAVEAEIADIYDRFPNLAARRHLPASVLSGGEQQMLAIGRGLLANPKIMMLDEPSLGLSPRLTSEVFALIGELNRDARHRDPAGRAEHAARRWSSPAAPMCWSSAARSWRGRPRELRADPALRDAYLGRAEQPSQARGPMQ